MKLGVALRRRDTDENLIPLINIVFLLLVFFMLAGSFTPPEQFEVTPPLSSSRAPVEERALEILLSADGRMAVGARTLDRLALRRLLRNRLSAQPGLRVQVKADGRLAARVVLEVMEVLRQAGVEKLRLLTVLDAE